MPPAFERRKHHKQIGGAVAFVFIIEPDRPSLFHLDRSACFGNQLLRGLVQANHRACKLRNVPNKGLESHRIKPKPHSLPTKAMLDGVYKLRSRSEVARRRR